MLAMVLGAKAQWLDWTSNNERVEIGFQLGQSATGTEYAKLGFGGSINLLGVHVDFLVVAPQCVKGAVMREAAIPPGRWRADDGKVYEGPCKVTVDTPLSRLPHFVKADGADA